MARITGSTIRILPTIAAVLLLLDENAYKVDCEGHYNKEKLSENREKLSGLIFTEENNIYTFHPNDKNVIKLSTSLKPSSPVFSCKRNTLYWIEESSKILALEYSKSQSISLLFMDEASELKALALDFITDKLYIGNAKLQTIEVLDLKNGHHGIIRSEKLSPIKSMAIDPIEGYLFIVGEKEVARMDLDGLNFHFIYQGSWDKKFHIGVDPIFHEFLPKRMFLTNIAYIALNLEEKRVYCMERIDKKVWSWTYNGTDEKFHLKANFDHYDRNTIDWTEIRSHLAFFSSISYLIDMDQKGIRRINLSNANDSEVIYKSPKKGNMLYDITSVNCNSTHQQQTANPCDEDNGGCQHLCILSRSGEINYRCFCNVGYELAKDGKSCILPTKFIAFSQHKFVRGIQWREDTKQFIDVLDPTKYIAGRGAHFDVDVNENLFYQSNSGNHSLQTFDLDNNKKMILQSDLLATVACDVAFDWASKNLYYLNQYYADGVLLRVLNTRNPSYSKILAKRKGFNPGLAVHPNRGHVFFIEPGALRRLNTDGSNSTILYKVDEGYRWITSLAVDYAEDELYWSVGHQSGDFASLYYSNLDGKLVMELNVRLFFKPSMMMIQGDWIYIINGADQSLDRVQKKKGGIVEQIITSDYICGLRIFDPSIQTISTDHPCVSGKNTCDKFCFAVPKMEAADGLERVCGCPYGEKLADDGRSCVNNSEDEPPLIPCPSNGHDCYALLEDSPIKI